MVDYDKILFAYLEEDNLQKAFFSVKPLFSLGGEVISDQVQRWPDKGTLRVVPDRNEQFHFKTRIRAMGHCCLIDMSRFPPSIQKIRTNKNYDQVQECNRFIIYSDAIFATPAKAVFQVFPRGAWHAEEAVTPFIYLEDENGLYGPIDVASPQLPDKAVPAAGVKHQVSCPDGITRTFLCDQSAYQAEVSNHANDVEAHEQGSTSLRAEPIVQRASPSTAIHADEVAADTSKDTTSFVLRVEEEKVQKRPRNHLQSLVTHQWKDSLEPPRAEPLPADIEQRSIENPVEIAINALKAAWGNQEAHGQLAEAILALPGMEQHLVSGGCNGYDTPLTKVLMRQLRAIEAERLSLLVQLDKTKAEGAAYRTKVAAELEAEGIASIAAHKAHRASLEEEIDRLQATIAAHTSHLHALKDMVAELQEKRIPQDLSRLLPVAQWLQGGYPSGITLQPIQGVRVTPAALIDRAVNVFAQSGLSTHRDAIVSVIYACSVSPVLGVVCKRMDTVLPILENLIRFAGWRTSFAIRTRAGQSVNMIAQDETMTPGIVLSAVPDGEETAGIREIIFAGTMAELTFSNRYKLRPYPIMSILSLQGIVPIVPEDDVVPIDAASIHQLAAAADAGCQSDACEALAPLFALLSPLSEAFRGQVCTYVAAVAPVLEGGLALASDFAILWWLLPLAQPAEVKKEQLLPLLAEYPLSRRFLC